MQEKVSKLHRMTSSFDFHTILFPNVTFNDKIKIVKKKLSSS